MSRRPTARCLLLLLLLLLAGSPVLAVQPTRPAPNDPRVRFVDYDPHNVVTLYARVGADTLVMFEKGEKIRDLGGGDTDAWGIGVTTAGNGFFVKPRVASPNTNIHVITDRRVYSIDMKLAGQNRVNYLTVWYRYPSEESAQRNAAASQKMVRGLLHDGAVSAGPPAAGTLNRQYTVQGTDALTPQEAWDDGVATYLRFAASRTAPAVYRVDPDGQEHQVNFTTTPDGTLVIHTVARKFVLRAGNLVACLFNEAPAKPDTAPAIGATHTTSPRVERVIKAGVPP